MTNQEAPKINLSEKIGKGYNRFWNSKEFYRVVKGGRGSKKSKNAAINFIYRIMKYKWGNLLVVRRYSNTNRQSTYTDLKWATQRLGVTDLFHFNDSMPEMTYKPTGQKILFRGMDDPLKIASITVEVGILSWVWAEEAFQLEKKHDFETLVESIRGSYEDENFFKQITLTLNPWSEHHWIKAMFFDEETREPNVFSDTTTYRQNEWLDKVDIDRMENLQKTNPRRARIVADGDWGIAEGLVFENFKVIDFDIIEKIKQLQETTHGMDFGFTNDPTTLISTVVDIHNKELWIVGEHYEKAMSTNDIYKLLSSKQLLRARVVGDSAEPRLISELKVKGVSGIMGSIKGKGSVRQGIAYIQDYKINIHPSCIHTIEEFNTYIFKQDNTGKWLNEPIDDNNHIIDALRYSLERFHLKTGKENTWEERYKALQQLGL